jgi:hypothetical protein
MIWHFLAHILGQDNLAGGQYGAWSGWVSDLGLFSIFGASAAIVRKHNCEVHGCWRVGKHSTLGGHHVCKRHHPEGGAPTADDVWIAHHGNK